MSNFEVDFTKLNSNTSNIATVYNLINNLKKQIEACNNTLSSCLSNNSYASIKKSLNAASSSLEQQSAHLKNLSNGLTQIATTYRKAESSITSNKIDVKNFLKNINNLIYNGEISGSVASREKTINGSILGIGASGSVIGSVLGGKVDGEAGIKWGYDKDGKLKDASIGANVEASGYLAKGTIKGNWGLASGEANVAVGTGVVSGEIGAALFKDGKLSPQLKAELSGKVSVASGDISGKIGTDEYNAHVKASGDALTASGKASAGVGVITYEDKGGQKHTAVGIQGELKGEAYALKGKASGGFTIMGIKVDASVDGGLGGAGVKVGGQVTANGASGKIGAGLVAGGGVEVSIDWSGFKMPEIKIPDISKWKWW